MHGKKTIKKPIITNDAIYTQTQNDTIDGDWNRVRNKKQTENPDPGNPANYYESTLSSWKTFPALEGDRECELVVIGGGAVGCFRSTHLSGSGVETVLPENTVSVLPPKVATVASLPRASRAGKLDP